MTEKQIVPRCQPDAGLARSAPCKPLQCGRSRGAIPLRMLPPHRVT